MSVLHKSSVAPESGKLSVARAVSEFTWDNPELACSSKWILPAVRKELLRFPSESVVVDLGCGNGSLLGHIQDFGFRLYGVDSSVSGLTQARKVHPNITFFSADLVSDFSLESLQGKCDVLISTEVIEHIYLPRVFAANCWKLLKPGGVLIVSTPYHGYLKNLALALTGKLDEHFTALWDYGHIKFWSRRTLTSLLHETGFAVERFVGIGRVPYLWKTMIFVARK